MGNYLRTHGTRDILMLKSKLVEQIKKNKESHIKAYAKAVKAYKQEALKQLAEQTKLAKTGNLEIKLVLTSPVNLVEHYDDLVEMFEVDTRDEIMLSQQEYNEYYKDKTEVNRHAMFANSLYLGQ